MKSKLPSDVLDALHNNRKIEAIKLLREHQNIGLKDAKDIIDAYTADNSHLTANNQHYSGEKSGFGRILVAAAIIAIIYGAYKFFS